MRFAAENGNKTAVDKFSKVLSRLVSRYRVRDEEGILHCTVKETLGGAQECIHHLLVYIYSGQITAALREVKS